MMEQNSIPESQSSNRAAWAIVSAVVFIIVGYFVSVAYFEGGTMPPGKFTLPEQMIAILKSATRVETFRVGPEDTNKDPATEILGYPILAKGQEQGTEFAKKVGETLISGGVTQNRKKCGLRPGVAFRIWSGTDAVEVVICFECNVLWPHVVGEPIEDRFSEWQDFDPVRRDFAKLSTEAFPDDPTIQSLSSWW